MILANHITANATQETTKAIQAFFNGLVSEAHPHFTQIQKVCNLIDKLDALYDDEFALTYEVCPNTGAYVGNDEALQSLAKEIHIVQQEIDTEEYNLATAITLSK